jgi:hypothetical protein
MKERSVLSRVNAWLWETTDRKGVTKDLADTRWDWLRTPSGLAILIGLTIAVLYGGPVAVWFFDDGIGLVPLLLVGAIFAVWFLLRRAVRLVADAPDDALDERLIAIRDRMYLSAYRQLVSVISVALIGILVWAFWSDQEGGISVALSVTWPQVNAVIWFILGQILVLPSLVLAVALRQRKVRL